MSKKHTINDVADAVIRLYLRDGQDHDVNDIAAEMGCSIATVRARIAEENGFVPRCRWNQEQRASFSKSYRNMQSGAHQVWVYGPSRDTLRTMLLAATAPAAVAS